MSEHCEDCWQLQGKLLEAERIIEICKQDEADWKETEAELLANLENAKVEIQETIASFEGYCTVCEELDWRQDLIEEQEDKLKVAKSEQSKTEGLFDALDRIRDMSERPICVCGRSTGTAAIKTCAEKAIQTYQEVEACPDYEPEVRQLCCGRLKPNHRTDCSGREEEEEKYVSRREMDCAGDCGLSALCEVTYMYTEGGKVKSAEVTRMPDGWRYRLYGKAGGEAPYCPTCSLKESVKVGNHPDTAQEICALSKALIAEVKARQNKGREPPPCPTTCKFWTRGGCDSKEDCPDGYGPLIDPETGMDCSQKKECD